MNKRALRYCSNTNDVVGLTTTVTGTIAVTAAGRFGNAATFNGVSYISLPTVTNAFWQGAWTVVRAGAGSCST